MGLKSNYKDDVYAGNRKYNIAQNGDGSVSFTDVTTYQQQGDYFGAADVNAIAEKVNGLDAPKNMPTNTIKGRKTAGEGTEENLTPSEVRAMLNVADGANNYAHPAAHPASIIAQDANNRFITDIERASWNARAPLANPVFTGTPKAPDGTDYGTARIRNIMAGTADLTVGSSSLASGTLYVVYE